MTDEPTIDSNALAEEAAASTYNPRAKRCWFFHDWSMWETREDQRLQGRRCLRCGKIQRNIIEKVHVHKWTETSRSDLIDQNHKNPIGVVVFLKCAQCGEVRRRDLA